MPNQEPSDPVVPALQMARADGHPEQLNSGLANWDGLFTAAPPVEMQNVNPDPTNGQNLSASHLEGL